MGDHHFGTHHQFGITFITIRNDSSQFVTVPGFKLWQVGRKQVVLACVILQYYPTYGS
jgi:hypothetical protein